MTAPRDFIMAFGAMGAPAIVMPIVVIFIGIVMIVLTKAAISKTGL